MTLEGVAEASKPSGPETMRVLRHGCRSAAGRRDLAICARAWVIGWAVRESRPFRPHLYGLPTQAFDLGCKDDGPSGLPERTAPIPFPPIIESRASRSVVSRGIQAGSRGAPIEMGCR